VAAAISFTATNACAQKTIDLVRRIHFFSHICVGAAKAMLAAGVAALTL
jgi:hypothetical protein